MTLPGMTYVWGSDRFAGYIVDVLVVHRAGHNYTPTSRNAIINEYKTAAAIDQWGNSCAFAGLPLARNGQLLMPRVHQD